MLDKLKDEVHSAVDTAKRYYTDAKHIAGNLTGIREAHKIHADFQNALKNNQMNYFHEDDGSGK